MKPLAIAGAVVGTIALAFLIWGAATAFRFADKPLRVEAKPIRVQAGG